MNKKGFTLLELIVIIAVVAFVLTPFSYFVSTSLRNEVQTKKMIDADQSTQEIYMIINEALRRAGAQEGEFEKATVQKYNAVSGAFSAADESPIYSGTLEIARLYEGSALRLKGAAPNYYTFYLDGTDFKLRKFDGTTSIEETLNTHVVDVKFKGTSQKKGSNYTDYIEIEMEITVNNGIEDIDYNYTMSARE